MKKLIPIFLMIALVGATPILDTGVYSITPTTVQPGQDFTVEMSIENKGTTAASSLSATLETTSAFELKPQSEESVSLAELSAGDVFRPDFDLIASSTLKSGTYEMIFKVCDSRGCSLNNVPITVRGKPLWGIAKSVMNDAIVGKTLPAKLFIENFGTGISNNVEIEIVGDEDETIIPVGKTKYFFEQVLPDKEVELDLSLFVNAPKKSSAYALTLKVSYDDEDGTRTSSTIYYWISVDAQGEPLKLVSYTTNPETIEPGKIIDVTATIKNTATSAIKDVTMTIPETNEFSPVGLAKVYIGDMEAKSEKEYTFKLAVKGDAEPDTYTLDLSFDYANAQKESQTAITEPLGIAIESKPSITVTLMEATPAVLIPGVTTTATLELANTGAASAYYLVIEPTNGYTVTPHSVYIGNLNPDDYDSVDFKITPPQSASPKDTFKVTLKFRDSYNNEIVETRTVKLPTVSKTEGKEYTGSKTNWIYVIFLIAVVAVVGWKFRKKIKKVLRR